MIPLVEQIANDQNKRKKNETKNQLDHCFSLKQDLEKSDSCFTVSKQDPEKVDSCFTVSKQNLKKVDSCFTVSKQALKKGCFLFHCFETKSVKQVILVSFLKRNSEK